MCFSSRLVSAKFQYLRRYLNFEKPGMEKSFVSQSVAQSSSDQLDRSGKDGFSIRSTSSLGMLLKPVAIQSLISQSKLNGLFGDTPEKCCP